MWLPMREVKTGYPTELAEYAVTQGLEDELAFHWWIPATLTHMRQILKKVKKKYWCTTHKYVIKLQLHSVEEALKIDQIMNMTFWKDVIEGQHVSRRSCISPFAISITIWLVRAVILPTGT